ncbi:hypothetical protein B0T10DRAFT_42948 [Thelonectria olida]|uniref:Endosomal spry domain-containing protein n=1 Tax=Thelonectria olida TaxID=1576542 RepID=A0A9P8W5B2_9HYPO|nr:hypothetical protein B0T10DRAFT_42948 [Thelonectria olida]
MAPTFFTTVRSLIASNAVTDHIARAHNTLTARSVKSTSDRHEPTVDASSGVLDPHDINNVGFFVLFALIGLAFVVTGIWFFFWAKNGGFKFKENDWDDYKSTVLRRKGPNGTILSGATRTTNLGGGSVYKDVADDDNTTVVTDDAGTVLSGITAGASDIFAREKRKKKQEKRDKERAKKGKRTSKRVVGNDGVLDETAERDAKAELRQYRHERAARVGGMNKQSDASEWDGSTNAGTESNVSASLLSDRQRTPTSTPTGTPTKKSNGPGIRKVYSVADKRDDRDAQRMRSEARRVREAGRQARRDFSYQRNNASQSESLLEGYTSVSGSTGTHQTGSSSDLGTKSYHHPMPELRELERERERNREERRARRNGYRRGRTEEEEVD